MKERIHQVMKMKAVNAAELADIMHITRPSLSHIINGRNNPSLDFVMRLKEAFPELSLDWLVFGRGSMTISVAAEKTQPLAAKLPLLFEDTPVTTETTEPEHQPSVDLPDLFSSPPPQKPEIIEEAEPEPAAFFTAEKQQQNDKKEVPARSGQGPKSEYLTRKPVKMILVYEDDTFLVYDYQRIKTDPSY